MEPYRLGTSRVPHFELSVESHASWGVRDPCDEDDNKRIAKRIKQQNKKSRIWHFLKSFFTISRPFSAISSTLAPPERDFGWMISSLHLPKEYLNTTLPFEPSWCLFLRVMLVDLPSQLQVASPLHSWRDHLVRKEPHVKRIFGSQFRYRRRIVFSEQDGDRSQALTGFWCVVAYVMSNSRDWLEEVDAAKLVSFDGVKCIRAFERVKFFNPDGSKWQIFYKMRHESGQRRRAAYDGHVHRLYDPHPTHSSLLSDRILNLRNIMDTEAVSVLYGDPGAP